MIQKNFYSVLSSFLILGIIFLIFKSMMPSAELKNNLPTTEFSVSRALKHVEEISREPHFVNSSNHEIVFKYLENELIKLGLETQVQEEDVLTKFNTLVHTKNLIARIEGYQNSKALLLLSHYDSAPHSKSKGASDDGNGLAVILESVRAFLASNSTHKNDIVIVFSDSEEVGLNGAYAFAKNNPLADDIGLIINFEARGTSGPAMMLAETNEGNSKMIQAFATANPKYPVSNSLMYSIYKMLPNDTDITAFRETKDIQGFNFAYIDNHFNYHTVQDDYEHFSPESLSHQASYLIPMLNHFSNIDINTLKSKEDQVYFNIPFGFIHYSTAWNLPLLIICFFTFLGITFIGLAKKLLDFQEIIKGFVPLFITLLFTGFVVFFGWRFMYLVYPKYEDILHGFTYNGHSYILAFMLLTVSICFWLYGKLSSEKMTINHSVAPIFIWLLVCLFLFLKIEGASYFVIPVFFSLISLSILIFKPKQNKLIHVFLAIPTLFILVPFIQMFPIGLGLKMLFGSAILTVFTFTLLLPVFGNYPHKNNWRILFLLLSFVFFIIAHLNSSFEKGKGKPNSLLYVLDTDKNNAHWATYDKALDDWTKVKLGKNPTKATALSAILLESKYNSGFSFAKKTAVKNIAKPNFTFHRDTIIGNIRSLTILIEPNRDVQRIDVFANEKMEIHHLKANGIKKINQEGSIFKRKGKQLLTYYPKNNKPLELTFQVKENTIIDMEVMTSSFDLLENKIFDISKRPDSFIPMPFVLNDAILVKKKLRKQKVVPVKPKPILDEIAIDSLTIKIDSLDQY